MIEVEVSSSIMDDDLMIKVDCLILLGCMSESCSSSFEYVFLKTKIIQCACISYSQTR